MSRSFFGKIWDTTKNNPVPFSCGVTIGGSIAFAILRNFGYIANIPCICGIIWLNVTNLLTYVLIQRHLATMNRIREMAEQLKSVQNDIETMLQPFYKKLADKKSQEDISSDKAK